MHEQTNGKQTNGKSNGAGHPGSPKAPESTGAQAQVGEVMQLGPDERLPREEIQAALKPRAGFEEHLSPMLNLYASESGELGTSINVAAVRKDFSDWKQMADDLAAAEARLAQIKGQRLTRAARVWAAMLEIYGKGSKSPKLRRNKNIQNFKKLMAVGKKKTVAKAAPKQA